MIAPEHSCKHLLLHSISHPELTKKFNQCFSKFNSALRLQDADACIIFYDVVLRTLFLISCSNCMNEKLHACICFLSYVSHISRGGSLEVLCVALWTLCEPFDAVLHSMCAALDLKPTFSYTVCKKPAQVGHQMRFQLNCDINQCTPHLRASRQMAHPFVPHMQLVRALDAYLHTRFHACRQRSSIEEDVVSI